MERKVFVSYRRTQRAWVRDRLRPTLRTCGCHVLVDEEWFRAGEYLNAEIAHWQDQADAHVLVWSEDYLQSPYCVDEMNRAFDSRRPVVPVMLEDCPVPERAKGLLRVDMRAPGAEGYEPWRRLLDACEAPGWNRAVRVTSDYIKRGQSVNLVATGQHLWQPLLRKVKTLNGGDWGEFDFENPGSLLRNEFVSRMLKACGINVSPVLDAPHDLITLHRELVRKESPSTLTLTHFDRVNGLQGYDDRFFATLRNLIMTERKLVLLAHSHTDFANILPAKHPFSTMDIKTVELR